MRVQQESKFIYHMLESDLDNLSYLLQLKPANFRAIRYKLFRDLSDATAAPADFPNNRPSFLICQRKK